MGCQAEEGKVHVLEIPQIKTEKGPPLPTHDLTSTPQFMYRSFFSSQEHKKAPETAPGPAVFSYSKALYPFPLLAGLALRSQLRPELIGELAEHRKQSSACIISLCSGKEQDMDTRKELILLKVLFCLSKPFLNRSNFFPFIKRLVCLYTEHLVSKEI